MNTQLIELRKLAEAAKPWRNVSLVKESSDTAIIGAEMDGEFYPCVEVDCGQYYQDSKPFADYLAAMNECGIELLDAIEAQTRQIEQWKVDFNEMKLERDQARAELAAIRAQEPVAIDLPEYHEEAMGCGLEDRGIRDRYEAMRHGWDCAMERVFEQIPEGNLYAAAPVASPDVGALVDALELIKQSSFNACVIAKKALEAYALTQSQAARVLDDDPLQGAVDWFLQADGEFFCVANVQRTLRIGYNRAKRLCDVAKERAAAPGKGGAA